MSLRAGAAEAIITPAVGTLLDGYGGREGGAIGVHDDLYARAVAFDDGRTQAAIVSCDLDAPLTEIMSRTIAGAVIAAHRALRPTVLKAGRGSVDSVGQNRRDPDG